MTDLDLKIDDTRLELPFPPCKNIEVRDKIIVLMDDHEGHQRGELNRNVQAFDSAGNRLWTIRHPGFKNPDDNANPFTSLERTDEGVKVHDWKGSTYLVDLETGELEVTGWSPR